MIIRYTLHTLHLALCTALLLGSCSNRQEGKDQGEAAALFRQLEGTWKMDGATVFERWYQKDGRFLAEVFYVDGQDTLITESILLEQKGGEVFYRATVTDQNRGEQVSFRMVDIDSTSVTFENPVHDFPTRITYEFTEPGKIKATVSGKEHNSEKKIEFNYIRQ